MRSRWGHIASGKRLPVDKAPVIIQDDLSDIADQLVPAQGAPLTFVAPGLSMVNPTRIPFEPFYQIHDAR